MVQPAGVPAGPPRTIDVQTIDTCLPHHAMKTPCWSQCLHHLHANSSHWLQGLHAMHMQVNCFAAAWLRQSTNRMHDAIAGCLGPDVAAAVVEVWLYTQVLL